MSDADAAWPTELKVVQRGSMLEIAFEDGRRFELPAEYLRISSPSAEVQGHSRRERRIVGGKRTVKIVGVEPIGTYAVKLGFDDGHATGLYTWAYLHELGADHGLRWAAYLADLESKGLTRDKAGEQPIGD